MLLHRRAALPVLCSALCSLLAGPPARGDAGDAPGARTPRAPGPAPRFRRLPGTDARAVVYERRGRAVRVCGEALARGPSAEASASRFLDRHAARLGAAREDLRFARAQPLLRDPDGDRARFTLLVYEQSVGGVPVFRGELKLLVRNEPGHPLVWANPSALRPTGGAAIGAIPRRPPALDDARDARLVAWAGTDDAVVAPRLAWTHVARAGDPGRPGYRKWLVVTDATSGAVLYVEDLILHGDVAGNVSGRATRGLGADVCGPEEPAALPYARLSVGEQVAYADAAGDFLIPDVGEEPVTVVSPVRGRWFRVFNVSGPDTVLYADVAPPGPADFLHNETNEDPHRRAEVNAYRHANVARDFALGVVPDWPIVASQTEFPVNVNIDADCNGFYDGASINFYTAGGKCSNTAFSSFVHHEYAHHLVLAAGNGNQGAYGEGMADAIAAIIADDPGFAYGYRTPCDEPRRSADNDCRYDAEACSTCGEDPHGCGQVLSGSIWDTRTELLATEPDAYREIIAALALGSIFLHRGPAITPALPLDLLVLDDDDANVFDGTPHAREIAAGFARHGLEVPLPGIGIEFPESRPELVAPGGARVRVIVVPVTEEPGPGTAVLYLDDGTGVVEIPMEEVAPNVYDAWFPAAACGTRLTWYVGAETLTGERWLWPFDAPDRRFTSYVAEAVETTFSDDFETDRGWTVTNDPELIRGAWERGVPVCGDLRGDPPIDADGSGRCFVTDNRPGNSDVDNGWTALHSPPLDATGAAALVSYARWFSNTRGIPGVNDTLEVALSGDDGATWAVAETIGPEGPGIEGGWFHREVRVQDFVEPTGPLRVRFTASDPIPAAVVEAGIDAIAIRILTCAAPCSADLDGSDHVDVDDLLLLLEVWGPCPECPADLDGDDMVGLQDLVRLLDAWGPCGEGP